MSEDAARLLAEIHAARSLTRDRGADAARPSAAALWAHAERAPGRPVDLAVERAIRTDPDVARRYRTLLAGQALAHAPLALAASDGQLTARRVGGFVLEILPADEEAPPLLVLRGGEGRAPRMIEAMLGDEVVRLELPEPVAGAAMLALDPAVPEAARLARMLRDPACAVFLL